MCAAPDRRRRWRVACDGRYDGRYKATRDESNQGTERTLTSTEISSAFGDGGCYLAAMLQTYFKLDTKSKFRYTFINRLFASIPQRPTPETKEKVQ